MSNVSNISTLADLRERREENSAEQKAALNGLTSSLAQAPARAKEYALEDLAVPALGIGLAVYIGYRVFRSPEPAPTERVETTVYRDAPQRAEHSEPEPRREPSESPRRVAAVPRHQYEPAKKGLFNLGTMMTAGKLLIPAAQAIIGVIQNQQTKEHVEANVD